MAEEYSRTSCCWRESCSLPTTVLWFLNTSWPERSAAAPSFISAFYSYDDWSAPVCCYDVVFTGIFGLSSVFL